MLPKEKKGDTSKSKSSKDEKADTAATPSKDESSKRSSNVSASAPSSGKLADRKEEKYEPSRVFPLFSAFSFAVLLFPLE